MKVRVYESGYYEYGILTPDVIDGYMTGMGYEIELPDDEVMNMLTVIHNYEEVQRTLQKKFKEAIEKIYGDMP